MSNSFLSPTKNRQMAKSLLYFLERRFKSCVIELNDELIFTIKNAAEHGFSLEEITQAAAIFIGKAGALASRIQEEVIATSNQAAEPVAGDRAFTGVQQTDIEGVYFLDELETRALDLIDSLLLKLAEHFSARTICAPCLISEQNLRKAGYLEKERHQIGIVQQESHIGCLSPAACLTTYPMLAKTPLTGDRHIFTLRTPVFRMEGGLFPKNAPLERLREYQVREIIFVGDREFMQSIKQTYFQAMTRLMEILEIRFKLSSAADIFFHPESSTLALHQLMNRTKYELSFTGLPGRELAISSLNFHDRHFIESFGIQTDSAKRLETACIGFGLQRWLRALLLTHGDIETVIEHLNTKVNYV